LIIGYGNPLRGDDGLGWHAAQQIAACDWARGAEVIACHQLTPELAAQVGAAGLVIFIDVHCPTAAEPATSPEQVRCQRVQPGPTNQPGVGSFSHHLDPAMLLACAQVLYQAAPPAYLLSLTSDYFDYATELSPAMQARLPALLAQVRALLAA
jgi:hydrogenase maturation protease